MHIGVRARGADHYEGSKLGSSAGGQGTGPSSGPEEARTPPHRLAQARHVSRNPLPDQARRAPVLRANPYPEVTDPICRLPLPTLFYRLEAANLGDLMRIWVRTGATLHVALTRVFKVRGEDPDIAATAMLFAFQTISPC